MLSSTSGGYTSLAMHGSCHLPLGIGQGRSMRVRGVLLEGGRNTLQQVAFHRFRSDAHINTMAMNMRRVRNRLKVYAYNVVITGGTKGIGKSMAKKFLSFGDNVVISSRNSERVHEAVKELNDYIEQYESTDGKGRVVGVSADVTKPSDVRGVAEKTAEEFGSLDIWVNNAGTNAYSFKPMLEQSDEDIASVVQTNLLGVMYGTKEAVKVMREQRTGGHVFNMDGAGADGGATPRFAAYGATKRSLDQFNKSIRSELALMGVRNVGIHSISPGMVTTDLLMAGADNNVSKFFINCLAETPDTVADFLVPKIREVPASSCQLPLPMNFMGKYIRFLTPIKAYTQILLRLLTGQRKGRFVEE